MRVLVACEFSGAVRDAFRAAGHDAMSCDLLPTEAPGPHYQGDVRDVIDGFVPVCFHAECGDECSWGFDEAGDCPRPGPTSEGYEFVERNGVLFARPEERPHWDLMIAHPPCTYLASMGIWWNKKRPERWPLTYEARDFVDFLWQSPIPRIAIENPIGFLNRNWRKPDQIIHPWQFGHEASKPTCLWLKGLPILTPTQIVGKGEFYVKANGARMAKWSHITSGTRKAERAKIASRTFPGIAAAMAAQWGGV
jgi:hypothetical protein